MNKTILLVDGNNLFRKGLVSLLHAGGEFSVIGDLGGGMEAIEASLRFGPDIVLIDIMLQGLDGLETGARIKRNQPTVRVVMLTAVRSEEYVGAALRFGADGYVLKDATVDELLMALRSVAMGKKYLSPDVSAHVVESFLHPRNARNPASRLELLTHCERSVLKLVAEGRTNRSAAEFLSVSPKTVEKHRANLMHKLGLRNAGELTLAALDLGLIERPDSIGRLVFNPATSRI